MENEMENKGADGDSAGLFFVAFCGLFFESATTSRSISRNV